MKVGAGAGLKICGLTRAQDLQACAAAGVDAVGLNLWPGSRRYVDPERARRLLDEAGPTPGLLKVGVFVDNPVKEVADAHAQLALDYVQLHGDDPAPYLHLGLPWVWVVRGTPALGSLQVPRPPPAWVLLDAQVPGYGGAGKTTDWAWAARAVEHLAPLPVWLAGGIGPANAARALREVRPAGLDVASGAELDGAKAGEKDGAAIATLVAICKNRPLP